MRLDPERFDTLHYIARQSWASAYSEPAVRPASTSLVSGFQARSLIGDIISDAPKRIAAYANKVDGIVLDIATDRRGIYDIGDGRFLSHTYELGKSGILNNYPKRKFIEFGSSFHKEIFTVSAKNLQRLLIETDSFEKSFILSFPYTQASKDNSSVPLSIGKTAVEWNRLNYDYYKILRDLNFNIIDLPTSFAFSTSEHTWGIGQDHFIDEAYTWWAAEIYGRLTAMG